ncbi:MAG: DegT/DnrJ/EryC1/StrS family aminotransferase [Cyanobium sp. CZS 48M]|nr:DegT/DnrJ/EryC1/StrS family aminotransferase [Cyanobium sp. CZS48M]
MTASPIPFNEFRREPETLIQAQLQATEAVLRSGWWILGQKVKAFEEAWAQRCGTTGVVGVANGLDAIEIGLRALGIGPGDEVITTALTAYATTLAIQRCGATPVFADIAPATACLDPASVERCLSSASRAVVVVHLYGRAAELDALLHFCQAHGLALVEDCAQAHGAVYRGRPVGSIGTFGAWSFYPTKNLGTIGDAGAVSSSNLDLLCNARQLRNYGQSDRYHHVRAGMNSRLDEVQAAILLQRLPYLQRWTDRRRDIAERYWRELLQSDLELLERPMDPKSHVHHLFVVRCRTGRREAIQQQLTDAGISTLIHYPIPCHHQQALGGHRLDPMGLRATELHCNQCLSLPIHPFLSDDEVSQVINACNQVK